MDNHILLYSLANTLHSSLGIKICKRTKKYLEAKTKEFNKLGQTDKSYYATYSLKLAQCLTEYIPKVESFELNTDTESEISHDFRLISKKIGLKCISLSYTDLNIRDIIPEKIMKVCNYRKNTNMYKDFSSAYKQINSAAYAKISSKEKYSELSDRTKQKYLYEPVTKLVSSALFKKRKCAQHLYTHIFDETDRIILKLHKRKFVIYDFGIELKESNITSFKISTNGPDGITLIFNNGTKFDLLLRTNGGLITEHMSLKFHIKLSNMDELFAIKSGSVV